MLAPHLAGDARHRIGMAGAVERRAGIVDVDAFERGREAVGIAFAPHLAVGDDVEPGAAPARGSRAASRRPARLRDAPARRATAPSRARAAESGPASFCAVDQPVGLGVGADQRGRQQLVHRKGLPDGDLHRECARRQPCPSAKVSDFQLESGQACAAKRRVRLSAWRRSGIDTHAAETATRGRV